MLNLIRRFPYLTALLILGLFLAIGYAQLQRDPPSAKVGGLPESLTAEAADPNGELSIPWPVKGNAAVSVDGVGLVAKSRDEQPKPVASMAKMMTAYVVMKDHPLRAGDLGPEVKAEAIDVQIYQQQARNGESVIPVREGTVLTQYSLLAGVLVPSGNNLAFMLARWSAGSLEAFVERMNQEAAELGMTSTRYVDPSGISPENVSTAQDQLRLAEAMMRVPQLARIVALKQADLPVAGTVFNVNSLLGQDYFVGVKTGWTEDAGGCFLFAADWPVDGQTVRVYGAVMGQDTLADAFGYSRRMLAAVGSSLRVATVVTKEGPATPIRTAWGDETTALPVGDASLILWPGLKVDSTVEAATLDDSVSSGAEVGKIVVSAGGQRREVPIAAQGSVGSADLVWRLTRVPW